MSWGKWIRFQEGLGGPGSGCSGAQPEPRQLLPCLTPASLQSGRCPFAPISTLSAAALVPKPPCCRHQFGAYHTHDYCECCWHCGWLVPSCLDTQLVLSIHAKGVFFLSECCWHALMWVGGAQPRDRAHPCLSQHAPS